MDGKSESLIGKDATRQTDIYNQLRAWQDPLTHNYAKHADPGNDADIADHADHTTCADPADHVDQAVGRTFTIRLRLTGAPDPTGRCHLQGPFALLTRHSWKSLSSLLKIQKRLYMYIFSCKSWGTGWVLCCFGKCWICDLKRTNYLNRCAIFWVDNALFIDLMEPYATCLWM